MSSNNQNDDFDKQNVNAKKEKTKFVPKKYPRPWQMELTEKERENLKKTIEEDAKLYKELSKKIDKDISGK